MSETYLECWGQPRQPLDPVIDEAVDAFQGRFGQRPAEILIPAAGLPEGVPEYRYQGSRVRSVPRLRYRGDRWHVAVGPVPALGWDAQPRAYAQEGLPL